MSELAWIAAGRKLIGTIENTSKTSHNPVVIAMWESIEKATGKSLDWLFAQGLKNLHNKNDEVAWCGAFVGGVFGQVGLGEKIPKDFYRASSWAKAGTKLDKPAYGCIAVLSRTGGGHVGFVVGKTKSGRIKLLGGNQSDQINIMDFDPKRITDYRWVSTGDAPHDHRYDLPILPAGKLSTNEA